MKARKKPIVIEAHQFDGRESNLPEWIKDYVYDNKNVIVATGGGFAAQIYAIIPTLEGDMKCNDGDYIIKGVNNELYPCKKEIFEKTYEIVNG